MGASDSGGRQTAKVTEEPRHALQEQRMSPPDAIAAGFAPTGGGVGGWDELKSLRVRF